MVIPIGKNRLLFSRIYSVSGVFVEHQTMLIALIQSTIANAIENGKWV